MTLLDDILQSMKLGVAQYICNNSDNIIHKPENDHWDAFDSDYYDLISEPAGWENFRRNGITCMLETGLYAKDRKDYIKNKKLYSEYYSDVEVDEMKSRVDELEEMVGPEFIQQYIDCEVGNPCHCLIDGVKYNFDDVYNIYALWQIHRTLQHLQTEPNTILEIGAGYGCLCNKLMNLYPDSKYIVLDLPESLGVQHYNLSRINPDRKILTLKDIGDRDIMSMLKTGDYNVALLPSWYGQHITKLNVDLVVNMRSLGEMTEELLSYYFNIIHSTLKPRGVFYCVNRYVFTSSIHKLKLKDYPFDEKWKFIVSQPQWLQTHLHEWIALRQTDPDVSPSFILKSLSERMPPPGPIMEDILPQKKWLENNTKEP
jgi:putative sugar O-methyltransferase